MDIQKHIAGFALAAFAAFTLAGVYSPAAHAQSKPVIEEFDVESEDRLLPGSLLRFTVEGTPKATASVRITGVRNRIPLKEVEEGVYEGSYTVKTADRFTAGTAARATLKRRNRSTSAVLQESLGLTDPIAGAPAIGSFTVTAIDQIEPGADIDFVLIGTPGGQASVNIEGLANAVALREVKSGRYEGSYTVRRVDKIPATARASGTLVVGGNTLRTNTNQAVFIVARAPSATTSATAPPLEIVSPQNNTKIANGRTEIRGRTAPDAVVELRAVAVSALFGVFGYSQPEPGQSTRADSKGNFVFTFQPQTLAKVTRYDITVTSAKNGSSQATNLVLLQEKP